MYIWSCWIYRVILYMKDQEVNIDWQLNTFLEDEGKGDRWRGLYYMKDQEVNINWQLNSFLEGAEEGELALVILYMNDQEVNNDWQLHTFLDDAGVGRGGAGYTKISRGQYWLTATHIWLGQRAVILYMKDQGVSIVSYTRS